MAEIAGVAKFVSKPIHGSFTCHGNNGRQWLRKYDIVTILSFTNKLFMVLNFKEVTNCFITFYASRYSNGLGQYLLDVGKHFESFAYVIEKRWRIYSVYIQ